MCLSIWMALPRIQAGQTVFSRIDGVQKFQHHIRLMFHLPHITLLDGILL